MKYNGLMLTLALLILLHSSQPKRPVVIEIRNLTCVTLDSSVLNKFRCVLHKKRADPSFSISFSLSETVKSFNILMALDVKKRDGAKLSVAQVRVDGCKLLSSINTVNFYSKFFKRITSGSNLPAKCPVQGGITYEMNNITLVTDMYPSGIFDLVYQTHLKFFRGEQNAAYVFSEGAVYY